MLKIHDFAPSADNPRNSEGAFYRRWDGNIGFIYSRFTQGDEDFALSELREAVFSADGTRILPETRVLFTTEQYGAQNIMCPSVVEMPDGRLLLCFLVRMGGGHINPWLYESFDKGQSFVNGREIVGGDRYVGTENDRLLLTSEGKLILWCFIAQKQEGAYAGIAPHLTGAYLISDDGGATFREVGGFDCGEDIYGGIQEPGAVELENGNILAWARTSAGCQYLSMSRDGGESFDEFAPSKVFTSPLSPMSMKRLADGRVIAIYNPVPPTPEELAADRGALWRGRSPLVYRTSRDGVNWSEPVELEARERTKNYCYTAIFPEKEFVLLGYCASDTVTDRGGLNRLRVARLDMNEIE